MKNWWDRSTAELLVLLIAATVCGGVMVSGVSAIVYVFLNPGAEILNIARLIAGVINTLIGLLAGFLAGTTGVHLSRRSVEVPHEEIGDDTDQGEDEQTEDEPTETDHQ
jgi:hypothetical protein